MRVNLVYNRAPHHAGASGYDQIGRYLEPHATVTTVAGIGYEVLPGAWEWIAEHGAAWMSAVTGLEWYDPYAVSLEAAAAARLFRGRDEVFHFLYGEDSYRFVKNLTGIARRRGHRLVATYHQPPEVFPRVVRVPHLLESLDAVIALCDDQASYLASLVDGGRVFTVRHGIDTSAFHPGPDGEVDRTLCLCVGSWLRDFRMLHAVAENVARIAPAVRFLVIGPEEHVEPLAALGNVVTRHEVPDEELLLAYQTAGLLVLPLTGSTANNSLLEGMASGLPVVATDVGGVSEYVGADAGVLVAPGDVAAMSEAIASLTADQTRRDAMSSASRARALSLDWANVASALTDVYRAVAPNARMARDRR